MQQINGDLSQRAAMHTAQMEWTSSPSGTVWRKRLHLVGEPESGQVTSVVRFAPDAEFAAHDHPEGEEILVLEGVFTDERGDWPAGSYLLNPEGFRHHPSSSEGCLLFVKLRQYGGEGRESVALKTADLDRVTKRSAKTSLLSTFLLRTSLDYSGSVKLNRSRSSRKIMRLSKTCSSSKCAFTDPTNSWTHSVVKKSLANPLRSKAAWIPRKDVSWSPRWKRSHRESLLPKQAQVQL